MQSKVTIALLVLTYNEIDGLNEIMPKVDKDLFDKILFVDAGSDDGTLNYLKINKYDFIIQKEKGLGNAYNEAISQLTQDYILTFSPDGNSDPGKLKIMVDEIINKQPDVLICSRYLDDAKSYDDTIITTIGNYVFTKMFNILYKQKVSDYLVLYRAFRRSLVTELNLNEKAIAWQSQLICRAAKNKKIIIEIPGSEPKRIGGQTKVSIIGNGFAELFMIFKEKFF